MADSVDPDFLNILLKAPAEAVQKLLGGLIPDKADGDDGPRADMEQWVSVAHRLQTMWFEFQREQAGNLVGKAPAMLGDPGNWLNLAQGWLKQMPLANPDIQKRLWEDSLNLWKGVLGQYGPGPKADGANGDQTDLPRKDRRFADPKWREQPFFALVHQTYLLLAEQVMAMADTAPGIDPEKREQLRFATRTLVEALSPANLPLTNPVVLQRTIETRGENLVKGLAHLLGDVKRGQLTHVDPDAFRLGENIAATPGKVVHETPLYQLIQYSPTTDKVLEVPLVIFPPWINRFYILDLAPQKSLIRWAVAQGVSVFVVSWKSADASMADVVWDDYIRAQIDAIDTVRARLKVKAVHTIGYCVAGTTLAATLAILARRGQADKVKSATYFTAQVDFEKSGELKVFIDDKQMARLAKLAGKKGYVDGRYVSAAFNLLRGNDRTDFTNLDQSVPDLAKIDVGTFLRFATLAK